jgi:hypothetical protein
MWLIRTNSSRPLPRTGSFPGIACVSGCLRKQNVRVAWLSVDEEDAEPPQFFAYLTAALEASGIEVGHLGPVAARGFPDVPVTSIVAALTGAIERSTARTVVIIDDYHRLVGQRPRADAVGAAHQQQRRHIRVHGGSTSPSTLLVRTSRSSCY